MSLSNLHEKLESTYLNTIKKQIYSFLIICIVLSISSCGGNNEDTPTSTTKEVTDAVTTESTKAITVDIASEVQSNREKWLSHDISNYEIEMQKICYCVPEVVRMMVFEVNSDEIQNVRYADTGDDVDPQYYGEFNTIESMFAFVEKALERKPADISVTYNDKYGYIKELSVDFEKNIADDEISIIASNMRPK